MKIPYYNTRQVGKPCSVESILYSVQCFPPNLLCAVVVLCGLIAHAWTIWTFKPPIKNLLQLDINNTVRKTDSVAATSSA
jgi:hypothetical protein